MAKHHRRNKPARRAQRRVAAAAGMAQLPEGYGAACRLAVAGKHDEARRLYAKLQTTATEPRFGALVRNDLAALDAMVGDLDGARKVVEAALALDPTCEPARLNLALLLTAGCKVGGGEHREGSEPRLADVHGEERNDPEEQRQEAADPPRTQQTAHPTSIRVAILSFLFNWPSTGGGNIHTAELGGFLARAGFAVRHYHARFADWGIGRVQAGMPVTSEALEFDASSWNIEAIQSQFREAVDRFAPDYVIITDAWNMKPVLAEAVKGYPYFLRFQAQECLCPLNNLRLLAHDPKTFEQCPRHQLASPEICRCCVAARGRQSGQLHQWERALAGVGTPEYEQRLRRSLQEAEAVLVLNPLTGALLEPYASRVRVVPWGMDPARFPWPAPPGEKAERLAVAAEPGAEGGNAGRPAVAVQGGVVRPAPDARRSRVGRL